MMNENETFALQVAGRTHKVHLRKRESPDGSTHISYRTYLTTGERNGTKIHREISAPDLETLREKLVHARMPCRSLAAEANGERLFQDCFAEWMADMRIRISEGTQVSYESIARNHILPKLGTFAMKELNAEVCRAFVENLTEKCGNGKEDRVLKVMSVLRCFCADMVTRDILPYNPAERVTLPRRRWVQLSALSYAQTKSFLQEAKKDVYGRPLSLMLYTAARNGEVRAIHDDQIDFARHRLHINRHIGRTATGEAIRPTTKNGRTRYVPLSEEAEALLKEAIAFRDALRRNAGTAWCGKDDLIFTDSLGRFIPYDALNRHCKRIGRNAGITNVPTHMLRRTAATLLYHETGGDIVFIQKLLGHADTSITQRYICTIAEDIERWGRVMSLHHKELNAG